MRLRILADYQLLLAFFFAINFFFNLSPTLVSSNFLYNSSRATFYALTLMPDKQSQCCYWVIIYLFSNFIGYFAMSSCCSAAVAFFLANNLWWLSHYAAAALVIVCCANGLFHTLCSFSILPMKSSMLLSPYLGDSFPLIYSQTILSASAVMLSGNIEKSFWSEPFGYTPDESCTSCDVIDEI